ncbi:MFS transporter [Arthrobacter echini]|uniref:MFS transporter n=1 Tax=Arthrobacter echini TaxID=1529066 RepID=A0A5D0XSG5_9MICC|nr:MFS transporter [Arthrobacter echini]TYC99604.1 MFS transporter [Arthrobacter echini]
MFKNPSPATPAPSSSTDGHAAQTTASRRSPLGKFGVLPRLAGPSFLVIGFFARLPLAMLTVGALTLVTTASGSYAAGGFAAGAVGLGSALGAPLLGLLADRRGQRIVLLISAVLNALAIATLVTVTLTTNDFTPGSLAVVLAASFAMGFTCPQIGPLARVRWMAMTRRGPRNDMDTALSYEGTADELTFVLGPALVGILASLIAPWLPLAVAAVLTITLVSAFAVHPTVLHSDARSMPSDDDRGAAARGIRPVHVLLPVIGMVAMGTFFGSLQTFLTAFAGQFGLAESAGLIYATMALSSAFAALSVAYWSERFEHTRRWIASAVGMTAAATVLALPGGIPGMLVVLFVLGIFVGPTMVTIFSIGSVVAPGNRLGTVMTMLASGIVAGTALGSALAGLLAESAGASGAAIVPAAAAAALLVMGGASALALRNVSRD